MQGPGMTPGMGGMPPAPGAMRGSGRQNAGPAQAEQKADDKPRDKADDKAADEPADEDTL